jgi:hypothetical protein
MEDARRQIQEKEKKIEVLKHKLALIGSSNSTAIDDTIDIKYDQGYPTVPNRNSASEYVPKTNWKIVYRQKSSTERRIVLLVWFCLLLTTIYMLN